MHLTQRTRVNQNDIKPFGLQAGQSFWFTGGDFDDSRQAVQGAGQLAGGIISGAGSAAGGLAQGAGQASAPSIEQMLPQGLKANPIDYFTDSLLRTDAPAAPLTGDQSAGDYQRQISGILGNLLATGEISDADKTWLAKPWVKGLQINALNLITLDHLSVQSREK